MEIKFINLQGDLNYNRARSVVNDTVLLHKSIYHPDYSYQHYTVSFSDHLVNDGNKFSPAYDAISSIEMTGNDEKNLTEEISLAYLLAGAFNKNVCFSLNNHSITVDAKRAAKAKKDTTADEFVASLCQEYKATYKPVERNWETGP